MVTVMQCLIRGDSELSRFLSLNDRAKYGTGSDSMRDLQIDNRDTVAGTCDRGLDAIFAVADERPITGRKCHRKRDPRPKKLQYSRQRHR